MGHILFGLPGIESFHLHSRVARKLLTRGHRVTVLTGDPVAFEFYCRQGLACTDLRPSRAGRDHDGGSVPIVEFAEVDCRLAGRDAGAGRAIDRHAVRLARWLPGILHLLETDPPDLVLCHAGRTGRHRLLHFLARRHGCKVLHTGDGLLPMTLQVDPEGIDGDASFADLTSRDYRRTAPDEEFLAAATAAWLGHAYPPALGRVGIAVPPLYAQFCAAVRGCWRGQWREGLRSFGAWKRSRPVDPRPGDETPLPAPPNVVLLLQQPRDPRLLLDAGARIPHREFIRAASAAVKEFDSTARVLVVLPTEKSNPGGVPANVVLAAPATAAHAVATAMAVITINHPLGLAGILSKTPVLHLGRTPYGIRGVSHATSIETLARDLHAAVEHEQPTLRRRFLTRMLKNYHIWCPPRQPDSNGITGLVCHIEAMLGTKQRLSRPLRYRVGPVWPLGVPTQRKSS